MNFLSHFYLDQASSHPEYTLGLVLPDLLKNAGLDSKFRLKPMDSNIGLQYLKTGWERHLALDAQFHNIPIFKHEVHFLFDEMQTQLPKSVIRNSFLAHIAFELMLDHTLLIQEKINIDIFYNHISNVSYELIAEFLEIHGVHEVEKYFRFHERFLNSKYLYSYRELENITYALLQICKRVWADLVITSDYERMLTEILKTYSSHILDIYPSVFISLKN